MPKFSDNRQVAGFALVASTPVLSGLPAQTLGVGLHYLKDEDLKAEQAKHRATEAATLQQH